MPTALNPPAALCRAALLALFVAVSLLESILGLNAVVPVRAAGPCDPPVQNEIVCENSLPGTPHQSGT